MSADPFGTASLRTATLDAWRSSPTRFREDANAEEDLVLGGYRDRWFVELAQNAADAASRAGRPGRLRVSVAGGELRVANTGAPLDRSGVAALASLRASAKTTAGGPEPSGPVGRFGVGFAAVLPVSDEPRVVSTTGGVLFSASRTAAELRAEPRLVQEVAHRSGQLPVLRLVWPTDPDEPAPPTGFDTEVRLPLRPDLDAGALLDAAAEQAADLLLALPALAEIELPDRRLERRDAGDGLVQLRDGTTVTTWRLVRRHGELPAALLTAAEQRHRAEWSVCWAVPVSASGVPRPVGPDVLHAPTPTDEQLSLPARLLATLPMEPSRRRVRPGDAADFVLAEAAGCYPELVSTVPPQRRTALVPAAGFPRSELDSVLRDRVLAALRTASWMPAAGGEDGEGGEGGEDAVVSPAVASVLDAPSASLAALLADVVPGLLAASLSEPRHSAALVALGIPRVGVAGVVDAVTGIGRTPSWWHALYDALAPRADVDPSAIDDLAALPVPLADGRTVTGPRGTLIAAADSHLSGYSANAGHTALEVSLSRSSANTTAGVPGLRVVHPEAVHPLLQRLGARLAGARELLDTPALAEAVERSVDDAEAGLDVAELTESVLRLVAAAVETGAVGVDARTRPSWFGALALPDVDGEPRRADELVLPDGQLRPVLAMDSPIGVLRPDVAEAHGRDVLRAVGVLDGFAVVGDEQPTEPDHDLADEQQWWSGLDEPPDRLIAVRDLDLVDDAAWPQALRLLAANPETARALSPPSYTSWWLARFAVLGGAPPLAWRLPSAMDLAGLYDPVPAGATTGLDDEMLAAAGVRTGFAVDTAEDAADLLSRLADRDRRPDPAVVFAAHAALTGAVAAKRVDVDEVEPPAQVRAITGAVVAAADALVLDWPWLAGVVAADRLVAGGDSNVLADLLDLTPASEQVTATVTSTGHPVRWTALTEVIAACHAMGRPVPDGTFVRHDRLLVRTTAGVQPAEHEVPCWVESGTVHAADPVRALLWCT